MSGVPLIKSAQQRLLELPGDLERNAQRLHNEYLAAKKKYEKIVASREMLQNKIEVLLQKAEEEGLTPAIERKFDNLQHIYDRLGQQEEASKGLMEYAQRVAEGAKRKNK